MKIEARPYRAHTDLARMRQLLMEGAHANISASYMHPGCLDWAMQLCPDEQERQRTLCLWEEVGQDQSTTQARLLAWAIHLSTEGTFDLFVHPALYGTPQHEAVMDEYVAWAEATALTSGLHHVAPFWLMAYDHLTIRLMEQRSFVAVDVDPAPPLFERTLENLPTVPLMAGFTLHEVQSLADGQLRAQVTFAAFHGVHHLEELRDEAWQAYWARYARFIASAEYDGARDLFVRSSDGRGASACTIWFDPLNRVGLFEPVATHPDFQRMGLGKAVMAEGLRRMKAAGMERAILGFDPNNLAALALYSSLGFQASAYFAVYRKECGNG